MNKPIPIYAEGGREPIGYVLEETARTIIRNVGDLVQLSFSYTNPPTGPEPVSISVVNLPAAPPAQQFGGLPIVVDDELEPGVVQIRSAKGEVLLRLDNVQNGRAVAFGPPANAEEELARLMGRRSNR